MNKKLTAFVTALTAAVSSAVVYSAENEQEDIVMPTGAVQLEVREIISSQGVPDIMSDADMGLMGEAPSFYGYGSDYGYRDMDKRSSSEERKRCYDDMRERCEMFKTSAENIEWSTVNYNDGTSEQVHFLPEVAGKEYAYNLTATELIEVYYTFRNDNPQYYWLSNKVIYGGINEQIILMPRVFDDYADGSERVRLNLEIDSNVEGFISNARALNSASKYRMAKRVHDDIVAAVDYGYSDPEKKNPLDTAYAHSIVGVMDGDSSTDAVCEGYAKAYQLVLNALGINNVYVVGIGYDSNGNGGGHAWNMVELDDRQYYWVDVTWDDQSWGVIYDYFAKGTKNFDSHIPFSYKYTGDDFLYELPAVPEYDFDAKPINVTLERKTDTYLGDTVTITTDNYTQNSKMFVAIYDDNKIMKNIQAYEDYSGSLDIKLDSATGKEIKVFIFENNTMQPLSYMAQLEL